MQFYELPIYTIYAFVNPSGYKIKGAKLRKYLMKNLFRNDFNTL